MRLLLQAHTLLMQVAWLIPSVLFGAYLGVSTGAWHMLVMSAGTALVWVVIKKYNEAHEVDLGDPVTFIDGQVWIGDLQLPKYELFWKKKWHALVYAAYQARAEQPKFQLDLELEADAGHGVIIGPTGSGKSELLKLLLHELLQRQPDCQLTLVDFKGGATFNRYAGLPQVKVMASDIDGHDPQELWQSVRAEIGRRELALAARGVSRIEDLNKVGLPMPRHYLFIDELATALAESPLANSALTAVAARGRSLGIHLLAATQSAQGIPRAMLTNLRARIALAEADPIELAQLNLKRPSVQPAPPKGWAQGILLKPGQSSSYFNFPIGAMF